jgi:serine/threonine-protein kinase
MENKPVRKIGKYEIIGKIAQGGMGALYKAKHPTLERTVLLKKLAQRGGVQFVERFKREARLMMDFKNDHIVQVHDHFKEGPHYFIVEEYVDGISLDALIRRERYLSNDAAMLIFFEACKALKYAHDKQVIHRDIKPGNILISQQGELKLVDFGIATSQEETEDGLTRDGMMLGTPAYVPPEQIENAKNVDRRADIYSLGVVLYEMLTGKTPFPGVFTAEAITLIQKGRYTSPRRVNPRASPLLVKIARKCMRVRPRRRYQDLSEIIRILSKRIKRRDEASTREAMKKVLAGKEIRDLFRGRRQWLVRLLVAVVLAVAAAAAGLFLYQQGYWYEYFEGGRYGALVVAAQVDAAFKDPEDIFFKPVLYRESGNDISSVPGVDLGIRENPSLRTSQSYTLESRKLYLPAGRYRLKINLEGQLSWFSFSLWPRTTQRRLLSSLEAQRFIVHQGRGAPRPLDVGYTVRDAETGGDLTAASTLAVFLRGRWVPWGRAMLDEPTSGETYRLRVASDGYSSVEYNLIVKPYQTSLHLEAELIAHPGTLVLRSDAEGVEVLLNDSPFYSTGGRQSELKRLEPLGIENREIRLKPGDYVLTARRGSAAATARIHVAPDGRAAADITWDKDRGVMSITTEE